MIIHTVIGNRSHRENAFCNVQLCSHAKNSLQKIIDRTIHPVYNYIRTQAEFKYHH